MADEDVAVSLSQPSPVQGVISGENGDEKVEQCPPFFSMCQPIRTVSYSNSWDSVCAPAATEPCQTSGLDSMDDVYTPSAPCFPDSKQPHFESISDKVDEENKLSSLSSADKERDVKQLPPEFDQPMETTGVLDGEATQQPELLITEKPSSVDRIEKWEVETKQQSPVLPNSKHWSSNWDAEPCDKENKQFPFSFSRCRQPQSVGAGLRNMGNTCFLNATLQCITHTVPLFKKLRCTDHSTPCSYDEDGFCSFCALKEHIEESIRRSGSVVMPARFKDNLSKLSSDFKPGQQEDAHEFLRCLLDNLHKCTLDPKSKGKPSSFDEESIVKQVFGGRLKSQLTCRECGHCSETFEPFLDLSLEIDKVDDLVAALESFTKVEQIGDAENKLTCESCNVQVCKDKRLVLDKSPDVIAFQLKRFTTLDNSIEKIDKHVAYPSELDLKPFHSNPDKEQELKYDLYGVVEHSGLPNYGHYVCTIRSSPSSWHLMNDSQVDSITETKALDQEAYILFYVRQGMFPWFSSLLEEATSGASPVSVLDNIDADCSTSGNSSSGDKFEIDEASQCKASLLPEGPNKRCSVDASISTSKKEEISPRRASPQVDVVMRCAPSAAEITPERPSTPPPRPKRMPPSDLDVFVFENLDDEDTPLMPAAEHQTKVKKPKAASASKSVKGSCLVDKNASRLMSRMPSTRRKGFMDCINTQGNVEQGSRSGPRSDPLGKKKRKYGVSAASVSVLQY